MYTLLHSIGAGLLTQYCIMIYTPGMKYLIHTHQELERGRGIRKGGEIKRGRDERREEIRDRERRKGVES